MINLAGKDSFPSLPTVLIVPSGIGCSIGGYAGDATPSARLLAAASGLLITHPNTLNGASLYWSDPRVQYVEGLAIDKFVAGEIALKPVRQQKIGLLLDAKIEPELRKRHLDVANACRASLGLDVGPVLITDSPLEVNLKSSISGSSWGEVKKLDVLLKAGERLKDEGATAIAIVTRFPEDQNDELIDAYREGNGVDIIAGAEAVISHYLVKNLGIPCAHAPALNSLPMVDNLDPRAAAEELGYTFLSCVLVGLSRAPDILPLSKDLSLNSFSSTNLLCANQLGAIVAPEEALGGEAVLAAFEKGIPVIGVTNPGVLKVNAQSLGIKESGERSKKYDFFHANNYAEAAGLIIALREGISRDSLYRPFSEIFELNH